MLTADQLLTVVWRRRLTFLLVALCVFVAVAVVTYSLPKSYSSSAYLAVNPVSSTSSAFEAQQVSQVDTQTIAELLQTRNTANLVAARLPYRASGNQVQGRVSISPVAQTRLVLVTASESSALRAQELAQTYATVFTAQVASTVTSDRITVGEPAPLITTPSGPRVHLYLLVGAFLALLAALGAAVLHERLDPRLRIDPSASELLGLPILARVPDVPRRRALRGRPGPDHQDIRFLEGFRWVFANLAFVSGGRQPQLIAVVGAGAAEGKSTVCIALANAAAETLTGGVLLVDGDLRRPSLGPRLGLPSTRAGLADYLAAPAHTSSVAELAVPLPNSSIAAVPSGPVPPNPGALLGLRSLSEFMKEARQESEFVIFDTPPLRSSADASLISARADGAVLVLDARRSHRTSLEWSLGQLRRARVNVLGVIINRASRSSGVDYYAAEVPLQRVQTDSADTPERPPVTVD